MRRQLPVPPIWGPTPRAGGSPAHGLLSLLFALFSTLCAPLYLRADLGRAFAGSLLALLALGGQIALWRSLFRQKKLISAAMAARCGSLGLLLGAFLAFGSVLTDREAAPYGDPGLYVGALAAGLLLTGLLLGLFLLLDGRQALPLSIGTARPRWEPFLLWGLILLCWIPVLLASWPGFFCNDVTDQWQQIQSGVFNGHSPVLHTLFMGGVMKLAYGLTGSYNGAIACYTLLQMVIISGIYAYAAHFLGHLGLPRRATYLAAGYYGLFPLCGMYGVCATKDSLYCAFLLLLCLCIMELVRDPKAFFASKWKIARFCLAAFVTLALRNNFLVAFAPFSLALVLLLPGRWRGKAALVLGGILALTALYYGPLFSAFGIKRGGKPDVLSVPMQQLARAYTAAPEAFTPADQQILFEILPQHVLKDYEPMLSDQIKGRFKATECGENLPRYGGLYLRILAKAPGAYADAFLLNTLYAWYPDSILDGYNRAGTAYYLDAAKCYFEPQTEEPGVMESKLPGLYSFYRSLSLDVSFEKIPLLSMVFSVGAMLWCALIALSYAAGRKLRAMEAPLLLMLFSCIVLLFNPIVLTRYYLGLFLLFPIIAAFFARPAMGARRESPDEP